MSILRALDGRFVRPACAAMLFVVGNVGHLRAQATIELRGEPSCRTCRIVLEPVAVLDDREAPGALGHTQNLSRDSRGRLYLVPPRARSPIAVFDSTGAFLTWIGRTGEGPGEYRVITRIDVLPGDTLIVYDARNHRQTILAPDYSVVGSARFERTVGMTGSVRLDRHRLLTSGSVRRPDNTSAALHVLDSTGNVVSSFGAAAPLVRSGAPYANNRVLTRDRSGRVWAAPFTAYRLEQWDTSGRKLRELRRIVPWFEPWTLDKPITPETPPPHSIRAIRADSAHRVWVLLDVPDDRFAEGIEREMTSRGTFWNIVDYERVYDSVIEVIDVNSGRVLVSHRSDYWIPNFIGTDLVYAYREDEGGTPSLHIWRLRLSLDR
jgi:hypothetical protein